VWGPETSHHDSRGQLSMNLRTYAFISMPSLPVSARFLCCCSTTKASSCLNVHRASAAASSRPALGQPGQLTQRTAGSVASGAFILWACAFCAVFSILGIPVWVLSVFLALALPTHKTLLASRVFMCGPVIADVHCVTVGRKQEMQVCHVAFMHREISWA
jgi:hypothetical protein